MDIFCTHRRLPTVNHQEVWYKMLILAYKEILVFTNRCLELDFSIRLLTLLFKVLIWGTQRLILSFIFNLLTFLEIQKLLHCEVEHSHALNDLNYISFLLIT